MLKNYKKRAFKVLLEFIQSDFIVVGIRYEYIPDVGPGNVADRT